MYTYCANNPILYEDASGAIFMLVTGAIGAVGGAIIRGGGKIISNLINGNTWHEGAGKSALIGGAVGGLIGVGGGAAAGAIFAGSATASTGAVLTGMGFTGAGAVGGAGATAASQIYKTLDQGVNFTQTTLARMEDTTRFVPVQTLIEDGMKKDIDRDGEDTKIFPDILMKNKDDLLFNYRLIILLDKDHEPDFDERVNKAFHHYGCEKAASDEQCYDQYVRGGVDKLYEKLIENVNSSDDYVKNLYNFMEEFDERYNQKISAESILDLCRLARS